MNIKNIFKSVLLLAFITIFPSCTDSDRTYKSGAPEIQTYELTPTLTVAALKALATGTPTEYTSDDVIEAYVTSNDAGGNFYKSISFQSVPSSSGTPIGFSVGVNKSMTFADGFYPGRKVYIKLKGLFFGNLFGSMKIGGDSALTSLEPLDYQKFLFPSATVLNEEDLVRHMTLANARLDANQNTLLEVDNVQFANSSLGRTYFDIDSGGYATNQSIEDPNIGTLSICRISQYAPFSVNKVPSGKGSIRGVMTKYNSDYQYMVRYESDFKLTGARLVPALSEDFSNGITAWNAYSVIGSQVWAQATFGNPAPCAVMSGYSSGNKANEDWLISPVMDLSVYTTAKLTFDSAYNYTGAPLQVLISNNYTGTGNPNLATWTTLTPALSSGAFAWLNSGPVNISSFTGASNNAVYVAFKYISTTSSASTWEIDNIKVIGN
jgi:hypothetical protein